MRQMAKNREPYRNGSLIMLGRDELQPRSLCVGECVWVDRLDAKVKQI